jgi:hypothetical protein
MQTHFNYDIYTSTDLKLKPGLNINEAEYAHPGELMV